MPPKAKTTPCGIALRRSWAATTATSHALLHVSMDMSVEPTRKACAKTAATPRSPLTSSTLSPKPTKRSDEVCRNERRRGTNEASAQLKQRPLAMAQNRRTTATHGHAGSGDAPNGQAYQMKLQCKTSTKALTAVGLNEAWNMVPPRPKNGANIMAKSTQAHR